MAALGSPTTVQLFRLPRPVAERVVVGDSFHVKPLLRIVQSADHFHVLCLQREEACLYEGNRDGLRLIEPAGLVMRQRLGKWIGHEGIVRRPRLVACGTLRRWRCRARRQGRLRNLLAEECDGQCVSVRAVVLEQRIEIAVDEKEPRRPGHERSFRSMSDLSRATSPKPWLEVSLSP